MLKRANLVRTVFLLVGMIISHEGFGQFGAERQMLNRIQKGKWKSAEDGLRKMQRKDSLNASADFVFSWYFLEKQNPGADLDSAHRYLLKSIRNFSRSAAKEKEQLKKFPIDSLVLQAQQYKIDSLAFERARNLDTELAYADFLSHYRTAAQRPAAVELRDEIAFLAALKLNTYRSFHDYLMRYPFSVRAAEARERYEKLLYADKTHDGTLISYEVFLHEFPASTWRSDAERNIFEISTASGRTSAFLSFAARYPVSKMRRKALAIAYYLMKDDDREALLLSDSLRQVQKQEKGYWVPFLRNGKFGFMDQRGAETIHPVLDSIREEYNCGNILSDYLLVSGGIVNREGNWIVQGMISDVQDLGFGFLKIIRKGCSDIVHKSGGAPVGECYKDVKLIARNFIAFRLQGKWGLKTLTGRTLLDPQFDDIQAVDTLMLFVRNGKKTLATLRQVAAVADHSSLGSSLVFDDCRRMSSGKYWVRNGALEGVLNNELEFIIPLGRVVVTQSPDGFILEENKKFRVTGLPLISESTEFDHVRFFGGWAELRDGRRIILYNRVRKRVEPIAPDSLWFLQQLVFARQRDSVHVYLNNAASFIFPSENNLSFIRSSDSTRYFYVADKKKKTVFNAVTGKKLFSFSGDNVEYIGHQVFIAVKGNKKGLYTSDGKPLLPIEYNAAVPLEKGWISLFKDGKFGLYSITTRKLVKPAYNRNVKPYAQKVLVAFRDTGYGFIDLDSKPLGNFEFGEIRSWNDTSAFVKKNYKWMIYSLKSRKIRLDDIKEYTVVHESPQETIAIVRQGNYYGVISNKKGELIPPNFSTIVNVGSAEEPLFFSEKNVEEAGIHVVVYYDRHGKILRKQALEEEEFERILCE